LSADWRDHARAAGHRVEGIRITITLDGGRQQTVLVDESSAPSALRLWSVILGRSSTAKLKDGEPLEYAWERNRLSDLLGFTIDQRGRLIGESWVPMDGLNAKVFGMHVTELARVSDWHELRLSGNDTY
jgi:hypothetical protein